MQGEQEGSNQYQQSEIQQNTVVITLTPPDFPKASASFSEVFSYTLSKHGLSGRPTPA